MNYLINFASIDRRKENRKKKIKAVLLLLSIALFFVFILGMQRASEFNRELVEVKKKSEELLTKREKLLSERRKTFSDSEIALLEAKHKFYSDMFLNKLYVSSFLNLIEEKTPSHIFLKSLDFDRSRKNFIIVGESLSPDAVAGYISQLQGINFVKKVEITRQTFQKKGEKKLLISEFELKGEIF